MEGAAAARGAGEPKNAPGFVEFRLRSTSSTNYVHNIMTVAGPPVNMADFTTPVRLIRDPSLRNEDGDLVGGGASEDEFERGIAGRKKRKTRLLLQKEDEEEQSLRMQERAPWLLEDFDGQHSYISQLVVPDSKYVIFVNQGNEFRVLLASKWYKFAPKLAYRPLTLEEAEERMASKGRNEDFDRWLMKKRPSASPSAESSGAASLASTANPKGPRVATRMVNLGEEGFDFEEFVDDDDGEDLYNNHNDEDDPSMPKIERARPSKDLSLAGKEVKKIVKHLDRPNYLYDSEDEGADPYADEEDQEEQAQDQDAGAGVGVRSSGQGIVRDEHSPHTEDRAARDGGKRPEMRPQTHTQTQSQKSAALFPQHAARMADVGRGGNASRSRSKSPSGTSSRSRSKSPQTHTALKIAVAKPASPSPSRSPSLSPLSAAATASSLITEAEIVALLREAPMRTKDLIARVKGKLRADPQNKDLFREIVRRVATVRSSTSQDEDKLLELRPEYR